MSPPLTLFFFPHFLHPFLFFSATFAYKLLKALEEANRTIALLREENKALEHALALHTHAQAPLPPSYPLPTHPSELTLLRDRVAYLESALESALEATSGELGPDWNLGELELDDPPLSSSHSYPSSPPHSASIPLPHPQPHPHPYPSTFYNPDYSSHPLPHPTTNGIPPSKTAPLQHTKSGNLSTGGKDLDKRPPFTSAVSPHSSRYVKPSDTAKLQIPKAPPDVGKPVIRIDLSSEMAKTHPQRVPKKKNVYNSRTIPVSINPVSMSNYHNT